MNLDKLTVNVRPLSGFQAMDLGLMMARQWFLPLWGLWWRRMLPVMVILVGVMIAKYTGVMDISWSWLCFVLWWLKPLAEVPLVVFLSQKLFDQSINANLAWQQYLALPKKDTLTLLTTQRLGFRRQLLMPILLLERQPAKRRERLQVLSQSQSNALTWQTLAFLHLESLAYIGILVFVIQLLPQTVSDNLPLTAWLNGLPMWLEVAMLAVYLLVMSVMAVFYVAGGFAAYICKRSVLEGWDIELIFRKLVNRYHTIRANGMNNAVSHQRDSEGR